MEELQNKDNLPVFVQKMKNAKIASSVIDTFSHYYQQVLSGKTGLLSDRDISPVRPEDVESVDGLEHFRDAGAAAAENTVIIMLNGGLGTSMGLTRAKSLIKIKDDKSFLEIKLRQAETCGASLAIMNSFNTHTDTLAAVTQINPSTKPFYFQQNTFPKIQRTDYTPANWPENPALEWNPPGHGDIYLALHASGLLGRLLDQGIEYAFISNSDNLGATLDEALLGYFSTNGFPFMVEVAQRKPADMKGGHLARHKNGNLVLREIAQCPEDELAAFQDIRHYRYFNTNNLWVNLVHLNTLIEDQGAVYLPIILNPKTVDPRDSESPAVFQVETAMASAISLFENAVAVQISEDRFFPVKKCNDLLAVQSDCFILTGDHHIHKNTQRKLGAIDIQLDPEYFGKIDMYNERFKHGVPSLLACESLTIEGDVFFEEGVIVKGRVLIANRTDKPATVKSGSVIETDLLF